MTSGWHDARIAAGEQVLRAYLKDAEVVGDMTLRDLAARMLHAVDKTIGVDQAGVERAWRAYAEVRFKRKDSAPTDSERLGMRAALGAALWGTHKRRGVKPR